MNRKSTGLTRCLYFALSVLITATNVASAAPMAPTTKSITVTGLSGMWMLNQEDFGKREAPPYTAEAEALAAQRHRELESGKVISEESRRCLPIGMPSMMLSEFAIQILESPGRITIISEGSPLVRSVYLNRTEPTEGLEPMWNGYSVGHWSGDALVVTTTNLNDRIFPLGFGGAVHSPTTTLKERFTVSDDGQTMINELTMEDPKYLTGPFTIVRHYTRLPEDTELWEYVCQAGVQDSID